MEFHPFWRGLKIAVFQTPNLRHLLLVRCIVEAALKMPHQTVWFPVQVVRQMSALQVKVVMDIPHVSSRVLLTGNLLPTGTVT